MTVFKDVKKVVGVPEDDASFDRDLEIYINAALANIVQAGGGAYRGMPIEVNDATEWWNVTQEFPDKSDILLSIKAYTCLYVRLLFDPPATSFVINAMEKQLDEMIWRIREAAEGELV